MTTFEPGQVVLIPFPFTNLTTVKQRPALVISSTPFNRDHSDIIVIAITSQNPYDLKRDEVTLSEFDQTRAKLPKLQKLRPEKLSQ